MKDQIHTAIVQRTNNDLEMNLCTKEPPYHKGLGL